jgi:hypothetical protein
MHECIPRVFDTITSSNWSLFLLLFYELWRRLSHCLSLCGCVGCVYWPNNTSELCKGIYTITLSLYIGDNFNTNVGLGDVSYIHVIIKLVECPCVATGVQKFRWHTAAQVKHT